MSQKGAVAGFYATLIALIFASLVGGLGIWAVFAATAKTLLGGWLILLLIGSSLGYFYSYFKFDKLFAKETVVRGAAYGVLIWIFTLILAGIFPILGQAAFAEPIRTSLFLQLLTHTVYGAALGLLFESLT